MGNEREYYAISDDGTMIAAHNTRVVHINSVEASTLLNMSDTERVQFAKTLSGNRNLDEIMYDSVMVAGGNTNSYTPEQLRAMQDAEEQYLGDDPDGPTDAWINKQ